MSYSTSDTTLLQKKKKTVKVSKEETLLILRAYREHPTNWTDILTEVKNNSYVLPTDCQNLYRTATSKQLRDRMSSKFGKLLNGDSSSIEDNDIREEVLAIRRLEKKIVISSAQGSKDLRDQEIDGMSTEDESLPIDNEKIIQVTVEDAAEQKQGPPIEPAASISKQMSKKRKFEARHEPGHDSSNEQTEPTLAEGKKKKRSLGELIRENQMKYNRFITKQIPKLLKNLGVSSSSESDLD